MGGNSYKIVCIEGHEQVNVERTFNESFLENKLKPYSAAILNLEDGTHIEYNIEETSILIKQNLTTENPYIKLQFKGTEKQRKSAKDLLSEMLKPYRLRLVNSLGERENGL